MATNDLEALEEKVDELIALSEVLVEENQVLKAKQQSWTTERAKLVQKNELAKTRVESMITRLKALDK
ncbi:MAG TPA: TIGR02449 family protein [Pseudomonadales bacterium]|jgi:cell division protein ZapB|nr:TIGR02449 family protein [Pseudomonadales bacterium]|tara:strand:+ start:11807 stop:12010 length:204 start_codon:yes stop_codon:yes gene_type:complete